MKPLVFYHANCADGFGAAFAAWTKFGDNAEYVPVQYGEDIQYDFRDRDVYVLDFSYSRERMEFLFDFAARVVWLDHHKTAFEMWCGKYERGMQHVDISNPNVTIELNDNKSGALLAWEYFHPGTEAPMLIKHIDDYDRWQFKLEGTKEFNKALWGYAPWNFEQWKELCSQLEVWDDIAGPHFIYKEGRAILRAHDQNVQSVVKAAAMRCKVLIVDPHAPVGLQDVLPGLAANCPAHLSSDVGHELATQSGTFGLCWALGKDGKVKASLRSNGDYDVSAIAKAFGGGGHKNAAGFETDTETLMGWLG